jgi:hypothetical protein
MTTLTTLALPVHSDGGREPAAGAVAADGLGHLAPAPRRADRRGRAAWARWRCGCGSPAFSCTTPTRPRLACHPAGSAACVNLINTFNSTQRHSERWLRSLQAVPALIGAFVGAPVLARELETGTFRYAWTQGFGRWRWTLAKLVARGRGGRHRPAPSACCSPGTTSRTSPRAIRPVPRRVPAFAPGLFDLRGVAFAAWTLAAFAIGALAGMLIRRVVPAIVATLAVYTGLAFAVGVFLAPALLGAAGHQVKLNVPVPRGSSASSGSPKAAGRRASRCSARSSRAHQRKSPGKGRGAEPVRHRVAVPRPTRLHAG